MRLASYIMLACAFEIASLDTESSQESKFITALTSGYVFKTGDALFTDKYGRGMVNIITAYICYNAWEKYGVGAKLGYWRAQILPGIAQKTGQPLNSLAQQVPLTFYLRRYKNFDCGLQLYASLGGGVIWTSDSTKEWTDQLNYNSSNLIATQPPSYFPTMQGEVETGFTWQAWNRIHLTGAFRYLFPPKQRVSSFGKNGTYINLGGIDLRAGISIEF